MQMNFTVDGNKAATNINNIVAKTTENKIQDLIPYGSLNAHTAMVLVNALYLKADFEKEFKQIFGGKFYDSKNQSHDVEFLQDQFENLPFYQNDYVKMIRLPFVDKRIHLYVATRRNLSSNMEAKIDVSDVIHLAFSKNVKFGDKNVDVRLPKFVMSFTAKEMVRHFQSLNVTDLFDESRANFRGLFEKSRQRVAVSNIRHKAYIEVLLSIQVSESGVEAAAASSLELDFRFGGDDVETDATFYADHQFFFFITLEHKIRKSKFKSIVFAGQYSTPP
uniref:Serpin domain-containing protein n=1 Tax=Romanomermis culicivorax TaxID=13658 RepID=A0A915JFS9_ROMCU